MLLSWIISEKGVPDLLSERYPLSVFDLQNVQIHLRIAVFVKLEFAGSAFEVFDLSQCITELLAVCCCAGLFSSLVHNVHSIVSLSSELIWFMSVLGNICLAECLSLVALAFRVPRGSYKCAVSSIACLLDICRAVEAVVADDRLGHSHFTSFLDDESAFLIEACNSDDIRISCLNLCQLCREVCIFISESFSIYDIDAQLLEYVLINLVFADHGHCCWST